MLCCPLVVHASACAWANTHHWLCGFVIRSLVFMAQVCEALDIAGLACSMD
jgi:hypothetical protein